MTLELKVNSNHRIFRIFLKFTFCKLYDLFVKRLIKPSFENKQDFELEVSRKIRFFKKVSTVTVRSFSSRLSSSKSVSIRVIEHTHEAFRLLCPVPSAEGPKPSRFPTHLKLKAGIFALRAMVDQARQGLCYQRKYLTFSICLT